MPSENALEMRSGHFAKAFREDARRGRPAKAPREGAPRMRSGMMLCKGGSKIRKAPLDGALGTPGRRFLKVIRENALQKHVVDFFREGAPKKLSARASQKGAPAKRSATVGNGAPRLCGGASTIALP